MRKSIITIALVCAVLVVLCSCSTVAAETKSAKTPLYVAPVVPVTPANAIVAPSQISGLTVNGAPFGGDPIMRDAKGNAVVVAGLTTAAGDPIMQTTLQTAAGDPIMMDAAGNYYVMYGTNLVMIAAAGDPIMLYR